MTTMIMIIMAMLYRTVHAVSKFMSVYPFACLSVTLWKIDVGWLKVSSDFYPSDRRIIPVSAK